MSFDVRAVDIVIPSAASLPILETTLPSVAHALRSAGGSTHQVVVVDDRPSRTGVRDLVQELGFSYLVGSQEGPGPARNLGCAHLSSDLVCFIDDDIEVDSESFMDFGAQFTDPSVVAVVGGLRPPPASPPWLIETYRRGTLTPATSLAPEGPLDFVSFSTALAVVRRDAYERAQGFPNIRGIEDSLFGLRLERRCGVSSPKLLRVAPPSGVHHYRPTWPEWIERSWEAGRRLQSLRGVVGAKDLEVLLRAHHLDGTPRARVKAILGRLPLGLLKRMHLPYLRVIASAGAEARGYLGLEASGRAA